MAGAVTHKGVHPVLLLLCAIVVLSSIVILATPFYYLAAVPACLVTGYLWLANWPQAGYYLIVFLIPFGAFRGYKWIQLPWILALGLFFIVVIRYLPQKKLPENADFKLWPWLILFFMINMVSTLISPFPIIAAKNLILFSIGFLFIFLSLVFISEKGVFKTMPAVIAASISLCSFLAVIGYFLNIELFAEKVMSGSFKRGLGGTTDPNNLALMIIVVFPFLFYYLFYARRILTRCFFLLLMGVNALALMTTFSRSGALVLLLVGLLLLFEHFRLFKPRLIGILIAVAGICSVFLYHSIPQGYLERQLSLVKAADKSIGRRSSYIYVAWDSFKKNPVFGAGPGTFQQIYARSYYAKKFTSKGKSAKRFAHNSYLEIVVGSGFPGLIIFITAMGLAFVNFIRAQQNYARAGEIKKAALVKIFRISYTGLCIYLLVFSEPLHKHLLVLLAMSQASFRYSPRQIQAVP